MNRKSIMALLLAGACLLPVSSFASDPWFDIGQRIGASIGNSGVPANSDKNFYVDPNFDFKKIRYVVVASSVSPQAGGWVTDPYIAKKYPEILQEAFEKKKIPVFTSEVAWQAYLDRDAAKHPEYTEREHLLASLQRIFETGGVFINAEVMAYTQSPYDSSVGNCFVNFTVYATNAQVVMFYSDKRLNAPRSSKEGMSKRIAGTFVNKFAEQYQGGDDE